MELCKDFDNLRNTNLIVDKESTIEYNYLKLEYKSKATS